MEIAGWGAGGVGWVGGCAAAVAGAWSLFLGGDNRVRKLIMAVGEEEFMGCKMVREYVHDGSL